MGGWFKAAGAQGASGRSSDDARFARFFARSAPEDERVLRLFDRGGYYTAHGEDATIVARCVFRSTAVVKHWNAGTGMPRLPTVSLNRKMFEAALRAVLIDGGAANAGGQVKCAVRVLSGSGDAWKIEREGSPGKLEAFEQELAGDGDLTMASDAPVVMAVTVGHTNAGGGLRHKVGVAFLRPGPGVPRIEACEFEDDARFCALESVVVQIGARECAAPAPTVNDAPEGAPDPSSSGPMLRDVFARCGVMLNARPKADFKPSQDQSDLASDLARLLPEGLSSECCRPVLERPQASAALMGLLRYTELMADVANHGRWEVGVHRTGQFMRLDAAALKALNVFHGPGGGAAGFSLSALLGRGRTAMGRRLVSAWLKQPLLDAGAIASRHDVVEALVDDPALLDSLRSHLLRGLPDVDRLVRKLERKQIGLADLCLLYRCSGRLGTLCDALKDSPGAAALARFTRPLEEYHDAEHLQRFEELLEAAVDLDRVPDDFLISPQYSADLGELAREKRGIEASIASLAEDVADDLGLLLDKDVKLEWHRFSNTRTRCLRVTSSKERSVRTRLEAKYVVLETRKDGTKFTTRKLRQEADRLTKADKAYEDMQAELVRGVVEVSWSYCAVWRGVGAILGELDALAGFADLATTARGPYVRPAISGAPPPLQRRARRRPPGGRRGRVWRSGTCATRLWRSRRCWRARSSCPTALRLLRGRPPGSL